jgi:hypothetical protein
MEKLLEALDRYLAAENGSDAANEALSDVIAARDSIED